MKKWFPCFFRENKIKDCQLAKKQSIMGDHILNPELKNPPAQLDITKDSTSGEQLSEMNSCLKSMSTSKKHDPFYGYLPDIKMHMLETESIPPKQSCQPLNLSLEDRLRISQSIREISTHFSLSHKTCFLALSLFNRYCHAESVVTSLQKELMAVSLVHISAKFEEVYPPKLSKYGKFVNTTSQLIAELEGRLLRKLQFSLVEPTSHTFYEVYCEELAVGEKTRRMALLVLELIDNGKAKVPGSQLAKVALYLAAKEVEDKETEDLVNDNQVDKLAASFNNWKAEIQRYPQIRKRHQKVMN